MVKKNKTSITQKQEEQKKEELRIYEEKKAKLEKLYDNILNEGDAEKVIEIGRTYYEFINKGSNPTDFDTKILHEMKERRKHFNQTADITNACINGDLEYIKQNIDVDYDINKRCDNKGLTLLCYAIKNEHFNIVKWLIKNGANVNCTIQSPVDINDTESLLVWCTDRMNCKNNEILSYIIDHGAVKKY
jgi:ankyrin repeat protein